MVTSYISDSGATFYIPIECRMPVQNLKSFNYFVSNHANDKVSQLPSFVSLCSAAIILVRCLKTGQVPDHHHHIASA